MQRMRGVHYGRITQDIEKELCLIYMIEPDPFFLSLLYSIFPENAITKRLKIFTKRLQSQENYYNL